MRESYKPLLILFAVVVAGTACLWLLIGQFLGSTNNLAADLASQAALRANHSTAARPLTVDRQRKAELEALKLETIKSALVRKRDAADSSVNAASVQSGIMPQVAERADSDDDIHAQKSIEQLQQALAADSNQPGEELIRSAAVTVPVQTEDPLLSIARKPVRQEPVLALDVSLDLADHCKDRRADAARVGVLFRPGSYAIKGRSLSDLDMIVEAARGCEPSVVIIETLPPSRVDGDGDLAERRSDEIKYYLLQRGIDKKLMRFRDQP